MTTNRLHQQDHGSVFKGTDRKIFKGSLHMKKRLGARYLLLLLLLLGILSGCEDEMTPEGENKKGLASYEAGDYANAALYFERAILLDEQKEFRNNYGMTLIQLDRCEDAIEQFQMVVTENPSNAAEKRLNKFAYRGLGIAYLQRQDFDSALGNFNRALELSVEKDWDIDILFYKANTLECMGYPTSAIENYTAVLEKDDDNASALLARGSLYREEGEYEKAISDYRKLLKEDQGSYEAYVGLYACYFGLGEPEKGAELLSEATRLEVKTDEDKYLLGQIHFYQGNYESARIEMENAVLDGYVEANYFLGEIALSEKEYEKALGYYAAYREQKVTESPTVCNQMAVCYLALFRYDEAEEMLAVGLLYEGSPAYQKLLRNQVALYEGRTEYETAYEYLKEYIVKYPDDSEATNEYRYLKKLLGIDREESEPTAP